jgi:hypothetical protein
MISKKLVLWISLIVTLFLGLVLIIEGKDYCYQNILCEKIFNLAGFLSFNIFLFPVILFFSLITYKMRDEVFRLWVRFTYIWLPLTLILVFIAPEYQNSWLPIYEKGFVSFVMSAIYVLVSIILVVIKHLSLKKTLLKK